MRGKRTEMEKAWHEQVARFAEESNWLERYQSAGVNVSQFQLHHPIGRSVSVWVGDEKVRIAELFVLPIPIELHDITGSDHPLHIHAAKKAHEAEFGVQRFQWMDMLSMMTDFSIGIPFGPRVIRAVIDY